MTNIEHNGPYERRCVCDTDTPVLKYTVEGHESSDIIPFPYKLFVWVKMLKVIYSSCDGT